MYAKIIFYFSPTFPDFYAMTDDYSNLETIQDMMLKNNLTDSPVFGRMKINGVRVKKGKKMDQEILSFSNHTSVDFEVIASMMEDNYDYVVNDVDIWERASVNLYIRNSIEKAFKREFNVNKKLMHLLFSKCESQADFDVAWSLIATDLRQMMPRIKDFIIRIIITILYKDMMGKSSCKSPVNVDIIEGRKRTSNPIITLNDITSYKHDLEEMRSSMNF